jgi:hypothetical protein
MLFSIFQCDISNEHITFCGAAQARKSGEPFCQFVLPLNWLGDPAQVKLRYDWCSYQQGRDFCRYFNTYGWRSYPIWDYAPRKYEPQPFAMLRQKGGIRCQDHSTHSATCTLMLPQHSWQ